jgi:amidohydrolase
MMKQEMISYLSTIKDDIYGIAKFLYENPESSFQEYKSCSYLVNLLKKYKFNVKENYLGISTAFYAEFGSGFPRICLICEYDAAGNNGHITGHNLISTMSIGAALALAKIQPKVGGTIIVLGCPGEFKSGAKVTMAKQGTFENIDAVLMAHPDVITAESGTSTAVTPLQVEYKSTPGFAYRRREGYTALDACLFTFNAFTFLVKGLEEGTDIEGVIVQGGSAPYLIPDETISNFYVRAQKMCSINKVEQNIRDFVSMTSKIMNVESKVSLYELPYEELITNTTLSRMFSHNLKESGIIDLKGRKDTYSGLSLGIVSHLVPCIHSYISIVEDPSIRYGTKEFAEATVSPYALDRALKTSYALAFTALDLIEKQELVNEIVSELNEELKNNHQ